MNDVALLLLPTIIIMLLIILPTNTEKQNTIAQIDKLNEHDLREYAKACTLDRSKCKIIAQCELK